MDKELATDHIRNILKGLMCLPVNLPRGYQAQITVTEEIDPERFNRASVIINGETYGISVFKVNNGYPDLHIAGVELEAKPFEISEQLWNQISQLAFEAGQAFAKGQRTG